MNKYKKAITVCALVAFIGTLIFTLSTMHTVVYTHNISDKELSAMTYSEATKIMTEGARSVTPLEFIEGSIGNVWFWTNTVKMWLAMFFISFISYYLTERWNAK
jgi:hypothetical protein